MTPIQRAALLFALAQRPHRAGKTGSGKDGRLRHPLAKLTSRAPDVQALVLCPTRELAEQGDGELRRSGPC